MKKDRVKEVHFYEWSVPRWVLSRTHDQLDATGRGIYRELLDLCYTQGGFRLDMPVLYQKCACTADQFKAVWKTINRHFPRNESDKSWRHNPAATLYRASYFGYIEKQKTRARTTKKDKVSEPEGGPIDSTHPVSKHLGTKKDKVSEIDLADTTTCDTPATENLAVAEKQISQYDTTLHDTTLHDKKTREEEDAPPPPDDLDKNAVQPVSPQNGYGPGALGDDQWLEFRKAGEEYGWKFSESEWDEARFTWKRYDIAQRIAAVAGIRQRIKAGDEGLRLAHPKNYLSKSMWVRAVAERTQKRKGPAWLDEAHRVAAGGRAN
jgi:hypothetical protein